MTSRLFKGLQHQIELDQELRSAKSWFAESADGAKVESLQRALEEQGVEMDGKQIEDEFMRLSEEEEDPFFSFRE